MRALTKLIYAASLFHVVRASHEEQEELDHDELNHESLLSVARMLSDDVHASLFLMDSKLLEEDPENGKENSWTEYLWGDPDPDHEKCDKCTMEVRKYVFRDTDAKVKTWCASDEKKDKKAQMYCDWYAKDHDVALGFVLGMVRPVQVAYVFCLGKGECKKDEPQGNPQGEAWEQIKKAIEWDGEEVDFKVKGVEELVENGVEAFSDAFYTNEKKEDDGGREIMFDRRLLHDGSRNKKKCMERVSKRVMMGAIKKFMRFCKEKSPTDPHVKEMCEWAKKHEKLAFGFLIAEVQPWKFGIGACFMRPHHGPHGHPGHKDDHDHEQHGPFGYRHGPHGHPPHPPRTRDFANDDEQLRMEPYMRGGVANQPGFVSSLWTFVLGSDPEPLSDIEFEIIDNAVVN